MSDRDPPFITSQIKVLLRQRNTLSRRGKINKVDAITIKINKLIERNRSKLLSKANTQDIKKCGLWSKQVVVGVNVMMI